MIKRKVLEKLITIVFMFFFKQDVWANDSKQNIMEKALPKIEYALSCNSKWGSISDVTPIDIKVDNEGIIIHGHYKQSIFVKGGEFNRLSGAFKGLFDNNLNLLQLRYKVSFKKGEVVDECIE
jgi:hypothetical protein